MPTDAERRDYLRNEDLAGADAAVSQRDIMPPAASAAHLERRRWVSEVIEKLEKMW